MKQDNHSLVPAISFETLINHHKKHHEEYKAQAARIAELEEAIRNTRGLLDTGFAPENWGMVPQEWAVHRIIKASAELRNALEKSNVPNLSA